MPVVTPPSKTCSCACRFPCSYNSPPGLTKDWSLGRDLTTYPCREICVGSCSCSDFYWDEMLLEIHNDDFVKFETALRGSLSLARQGRGGNRLYPGPQDLELDIPCKIYTYDIVEEYYWKSHGFMNGKHPTDVVIRGLPPCLHRLYFHIEEIYANWDTDLAELTLLVDENQKRSREEYLEELKNQEKALANDISCQPPNSTSSKRQRLTGNEFQTPTK